MSEIEATSSGHRASPFLGPWTGLLDQKKLWSLFSDWISMSLYIFLDMALNLYVLTRKITTIHLNVSGGYYEW